MMEDLVEEKYPVTKPKSIGNLTAFILELLKLCFTDSLQIKPSSEFSKWIWKEIYGSLVRSGCAEFPCFVLLQITV